MIKDETHRAPQSARGEPDGSGGVSGEGWPTGPASSGYYRAAFGMSGSRNLRSLEKKALSNPLSKCAAGCMAIPAKAQRWLVSRLLNRPVRLRILPTTRASFDVSSPLRLEGGSAPARLRDVRAGAEVLQIRFECRGSADALSFGPGLLVRLPRLLVECSDALASFRRMSPGAVSLQ